MLLPSGRLVGERRELRGVRHARHRHAGRGEERHRLAVADRDGPRLVEEQHVHVARGLDRLAAHREHVLLHHPVDPGDADGAEQPADRRRDQTDEERDEHRDREGRLGEVRRVAVNVRPERLQADAHDEKDDRERRQEDVERDLVGGLLALGALDEGDHPVEEALARVRAHPHPDPVREHGRAAGDGGSVAAGFADDRRGLAGDDRFVDGGGALDHLAVAGDDLARHDDDDVALAQGLGRHLLGDPAGRGLAVRERLRPRLAQGVGLGLAAAFGERLGEVREDDREPEPERDLDHEADRFAVRLGAEHLHRGDERADLRDEHHGVADHVPWVELLEAGQEGRDQDVAFQDGSFVDMRCHGRCASKRRERVRRSWSSRPSGSAPRWGRRRARGRR